MKHLNMACVAYSGEVTVGFCQSMVQTVVACTKAKIGLTTDYRTFNCYVHNGRNWLVHRFLQSTADALLFVDADVKWPGDAVVKLYESDFYVCGGAYPLKQEDEDFPVKLTGHTYRGFKEAYYLPTGFMLIRREAFELVKPHVPTYKDRYNNGAVTHAYFQNIVTDEGETGEDVTFCNRFRALGGHLWCLPDIDFEHQGTRIWQGNYGRFLGPQEKAA